MTFNIFVIFAEFERELISERTLAGVQTVRERGRIGGRIKALFAKAKKTAYTSYQLWKDQTLSIPEILKVVNQ